MDFGSTADILRIGGIVACAGVGWYVLDKTFRKIISNQHKLQHTLDAMLLRLNAVDQILLHVQRPGAATPAAGTVHVECGLKRDNADIADLLRGAVHQLADISARQASAQRLATANDGPPLPILEGKTLLIFGIGDAEETVDIVRRTQPRHVQVVDAAAHALEQARNRLLFEEKQPAELALLVDGPTLPTADGSVDFIHAEGALPAEFPLRQVLSEFRRVLAGGGQVRLALNNYDSIMTHLYQAYLQKHGANGSEGGRTAVASAVRREEFIELAERYGFVVNELSCQVSPIEMSVLHRRFDAVADRRLGREHMEFLRDLTFDERGRPMHGGRVAGYRTVYQLTLAPAPRP